MKQPSQQNAILFEAVYEGTVSQELSEYLRTTAGISGRSLRKYFFRGLVFLNRRKAHSAAQVKPGDSVKVLQAREQPTLTGADIALDIVYEDRELLVVNKPAGMAVHPAGQITARTLSHGVAAYFEKIGLAARVRPVNRLDYGTSGLVIFAKSAAGQEKISRSIREHRISRIYTALVRGIPAPTSGVIDCPILETRGRRIVATQGQTAQTHYRVLDTFPPYSLLELRLITGRTHQIRVHLHQIGLPIVGDAQYGCKSPLIDRPALHAGRLEFQVPEFAVPPLEAPLPEDFRFLIEKVKPKAPAT